MSHNKAQVKQLVILYYMMCHISFLLRDIRELKSNSFNYTMKILNYVYLSQIILN